MQDPREKAIEEKRERVAKNELQRLRNIARAKNTKVPGVGLTPTASADPKQSSNDLKKASELAKKSTASLGKFQEKLPKAMEKRSKGAGGKKRKFDSLLGNSNEEKAKNLKVLDQITNKQPKLSVTKAVGHHINQEEKSRSADKRSNKKGSKAGGKNKRSGGNNRGNFGKKGQNKGFGGPSKKGGVRAGGGGKKK